MTFSAFYNRVYQLLSEEKFEALVLTYIECYWHIVHCSIDPNALKVYELIAKSNDEYYSLIVNYNNESGAKSYLTKANVLIASPTEENIVNMAHFLCALPTRQVPMCLRDLYAFLRQNESIKEDSRYQILLGKGFAEKQIDDLVCYERMQNEEEKKRYDLCTQASLQALNNSNTVWIIEKWNKNHTFVTLTNSKHIDKIQLFFRYFSDAHVWYYNASERIERQGNKEFDIEQFAEQVLEFYRNQCGLRSQEP